MGGGFISRGFRGRRRQQDATSERVPPGQYLVDGFPVLSAGPTPRTPLSEWSFSVEGEVDETKIWSWEEFRALPSEEITRDIHCVTKWSKLDTTWEGVSVDTLLDGVETAAGYVLAFSDGGYTTNLPLEEVKGGQAWVAHTYEGEPLSPEHGGPARLLVPHLYFWKSAKWVRGLRLTDQETSLASGSRSAITTTATRGASNATGVTEVAGSAPAQARLADRRGGRDKPRDAADEEPVPGGAGLAGAQGGPARRRQAHRRGRVPGPEKLFDSLGAGERAGRARRRASRRRRGLTLPGRRAAGPATVWSCAVPSGAGSPGTRRRAGPCSSSQEGRGSRLSWR